ncbi:MAG: amphi-Trp domain-containing protein [Thermodesulfobacteriota bacterium]|nr:amphi-Trp domain-containing protein [Thermodesulfobacteriota bacterium]
MPQDKFSYESIQDIESVKRYFNSLLESMENRRIVLKSEDKEIVLEIDQLFRFAVRARKKGRENKLSIKMSWTSNGEGKDSDTKTMTIGS